MTKKQLLERIKKLEEQVAGMQAEINLLSMAACKPEAHPIWIYDPYPYLKPPYIVTCGTTTKG